MSQCCEKPKRSIKGDLWVSGADPGTASVSALAGEGGGSGEGGLSSTMRGWLSASASSTCTSGCSFVAGTWREEGEDGQRERETDGQADQVLGALLCSSKKPQKGCLEQLLAASPLSRAHRSALGRECKNAKPSRL